MGMYGTITLFPRRGLPPEVPEAAAWAIGQCLERAGLIRPNAAAEAREAEPDWSWLSRAEDLAEEGDRPEYFIQRLPDDAPTPAIEGLVPYWPDFSQGLDLPDITIAASTRRLPLIDGVSGTDMGVAWATIEFSYQDIRLDPDFHRLHDEAHPIFRALDAVLGGDWGWTVLSG